MAMVGGLNSKRFAGKPLKQPTYSFKDIPRCNKDLKGSSLQEVCDREQINEAMAEMILLCNETMRRLHIEQKVGKRTSKPLSLEYIADRLDVDDPMFGYFVRTDTPPRNVNDQWRKGMLQGFITVTTFTNWQKSFRWDSMHDSAFAYDDEALAEAMASGVRQYDENGSLAEALQSTVRCGDPWNEGIVWPRIAEISLLGGMGCGKALVSLVIEKLEAMKPTCKHNYDYVTLQATENSIPFYESLGFVRVGGITEDDKYEEKQAKLKGADSSTNTSDSSSDSTSPLKSEIVSSSVDMYVTNVPGETPADIAKALNVDVWDIIFLNHYMYPDIGTRSRLMKDTSLYVPAAHDAQAEATSHACRSREYGTDPSAPQWYIADENDTPRMIAKKFNVDSTELVNANRGRLPGLQWQSRLKEGTRIKVSHFHLDDDKHVPYCHWTFPDDSFETSEPSYMMVRKLNRRKGPAIKIRPVEASLAVPVTEFTPPPSELFKEPIQTTASQSAAKAKTPKSSKKHPDKPKKPKRPVNGFLLYCAEQRELMKDDLVGMKGTEIMKIMSDMWRDVPECEKALYQAERAEEKRRYDEAMEKYKKDLASFYEANPQIESSEDGNDATSQTLFNKVVKLNEEGKAQTGSEYEYFFVLTYIPDLCWAHLAPLECVGKWGPEKPKAEGRPIWMLVDESEGKEVDISSSFCIPIRSRAMKRTANADCEQWDILESDANTPSRDRKIRLAPVFTNRASDRFNTRQSHSATKPLSGSIETQGKVKKKRGRPRKHPLPDPGTQVAAPKNPGRPRKQQHSARKPLNGAVEPKKRGRGRPKKDSSFESRTEKSSPIQPSSVSVETKKRGPGRPRKHPLPETVPEKPATGGRTGRPPKRRVSPATPCWGRIESDSEDDDWDLQDDKPKKRGGATKQSRSATKPLDGAIEPKKRKRGRPSKNPVVQQADCSDEEATRPTKRRKLPRRSVAAVNASYKDVEHSDIDDVEKRKRGRPSKNPVVQQADSSDEEIARPTKRRQLPRRSVAAVNASYKDVEHSDIDDVTTPAKPKPRKKRGTRTPEARPGSSPFRTVALTRSAKKLSMTSPLMFSPRRARVS